MTHNIAHKQLSDAVMLYNKASSFPPTDSSASRILRSTYTYIFTIVDYYASRRFARCSPRRYDYCEELPQQDALINVTNLYTLRRAWLVEYEDLPSSFLPYGCVALEADATGNSKQFQFFYWCRYWGLTTWNWMDRRRVPATGVARLGQPLYYLP